ncbi:MAG TPA: undecaprenyldiphospho-muramoylpentapeptide beta-N-acetylglucosaminyltransferase [Actinomycetota bacterium]|jgi:UDP-N-acetylglucosamine--N-acetylmuramyl-(pentapeptide) pyrophosphoryl-undecaprenol N-acetylglucosamine transferase|nr:undecaprenyldiphospho-muramoylpentapeptide beta-N-acetylglucosaminyltransferase [Actinomycetota bacterium]
MKVTIAAGGTAGHIFPALALGRRLADEGVQVGFVGTAAGQESRLVPAAGFAFAAVEARPFVRTVSIEMVRAPVAALRSVRQCRPLVEDSDVVVGMGGYASVPAGLAALRGRRPLVLHEQNAVPGLANRSLAIPARSVALAFAEAARLLPKRTRTVVTGNPVRAEILAVPEDRETLAKEARSELGLDPDRATVVVFGGSQGALHVNRATVEAVERLRHRGDLQILLLTGPANLAEVRRRLSENSIPLIRTVPFLERMELAYAVADLIVGRAGATTVAEISVCGLPSILVPYPYATARHQEANARALAHAGAAAILMDHALSGAVLASRITELIGDRGRLRVMGARASAWARPDAAEALARVVREAAR